MEVETRYVTINSRAQHDIIDITGAIEIEISSTSIKNGIVNIFCPGSTGAITTIEYESGLKQDIADFLEKIIPYNKNYKHHQTWGDDNGSGHLQSALLKTSFTVPIVNGKLTLGTWQQIIFCECDTRGRSRRLVVQILGK
jgi:secondary thiamine-phosphate synthase enzyme